MLLFPTSGKPGSFGLSVPFVPGGCFSFSGGNGSRVKMTACGYARESLGTCGRLATMDRIDASLKYGIGSYLLNERELEECRSAACGFDAELPDTGLLMTRALGASGRIATAQSIGRNPRPLPGRRPHPLARMAGVRPWLGATPCGRSVLGPFDRATSNVAPKPPPWFSPAVRRRSGSCRDSAKSTLEPGTASPAPQGLRDAAHRRNWP